MNLDNFVKMRALVDAYQEQGSKLTDHLLNGKNGEEVREQLEMKRLQFDASSSLYAEVESICSLLDCSKREFLEMVVSDGVEKAKSIYGVVKKEVSFEVVKVEEV